LLTGQGLIGKLALFMAEKLISHKLAISLDEKKRACRAFVEFYHCLDRLEEVNSKVVRTLSFGVEHGGILIGDLELLMPAVNTVSQRLLECRGELYYAIELIDPALANAVTQIYEAKGSFLLMLSDSVRYKDGSGDTASIKYLAPDPRILEIDMESYEEWVEHFSASTVYDKHSLEWPQSLLWYGEFQQGFHPARLLLTDRSSLDQLRTILVAHGAVLSLAREKMREFIAAKFAAGDILYVSKGMQRDEF
jgi:hypothetical protein